MYPLLRTSVRLALHLFCGRIRVLHATALPKDVPLVLACNHPNSFFDALIIATTLDREMFFLTRGDAFRKPIYSRLLRTMNMIPIFRMSEGRSELHLTEHSFSRSQEVLANGKALLIFSEGLSVNAPGLRPLGKGTARIAHRAWRSEPTGSMIVLPVWLRYDTFNEPFLDVVVGVGDAIGAGAFEPTPEATFLRDLNATLKERLLATSEEVDAYVATDTANSDHSRPLLRIMLGIPALIGFVLHAPWYFALRSFTSKKTRGSVFFDSVLFGLLFLTYPIWLLTLIALALSCGSGSYALVVPVIAPLSLLALRKAWR